MVLAAWHVARRHPKASLAIVLTGCLLYLLIWYLQQPAKPEYITETAKRQDLVQIVEAVGEVISEKDIKLQFPITGIVDAVLVEEGDTVEKGQQLARLRSSGLSADVNSASAQVAAAQAELRRLEEGTRPEEIAVREAVVQNKRASLEAARESLRSAERTLETSQLKLDFLRREAETSLQGYVSTAQSTASQQLSIGLTAARTMDGVLDDVSVLDVFIKHDPHVYQQLKQSLAAVQLQIETDVLQASSASTYSEVIIRLQQAKVHLTDLATALNDAYNTLSALPITGTYTNTVRESTKTTVATQRSNVQTAISSVDSVLKSLRDASANFETQIASEEKTVISAEGSRDKAKADILTYETSLRIDEAELALLRAGTRPADIDAARARLNQAYAQLQRARERYQDTVIIAPIDGTITKVNLKEGELLSTSFASDAAITMLGESPYRIEIFVAEIDIPKIMLTQSGTIVPDAFPGDLFALTVSEIDPVATMRDGVPKYRVKLDFDQEFKQRLRIGMTGDTEVYTDFRGDVVTIPGRAVMTGDDGQDIVRVLQMNGIVREQEVVVGMDGQGGEVEIIEGIEEGQEVVVLVRE